MTNEMVTLCENISSLPIHNESESLADHMYSQRGSHGSTSEKQQYVHEENAQRKVQEQQQEIEESQEECVLKNQDQDQREHQQEQESEMNHKDENENDSHNNETNEDDANETIVENENDSDNEDTKQTNNECVEISSYHENEPESYDESTYDAEEEQEEEEEEEEEITPEMEEELNSLCESFSGLKSRYRLINKIGEGTFSSVYKAEDLLNIESSDGPYGSSWSTPPLKRLRYSNQNNNNNNTHSRRKGRIVALKRIYVTSSPQRIYNELHLLYTLSGCRNIAPLLDAIRYHDQVLAVLPYYKHYDFRDFYRTITLPDIRIYMRELFQALAFVHDHKVIHRDIKPTNFLYDPYKKRGVLVDFGLAEKENAFESSTCPCKNRPTILRSEFRTLGGYPKDDTRPGRRANRAGTRGFRAPEVLFKCTNQSTKIDIWAAGVILLTFLSRRFPFFNSPDDVEALIEISTIFGKTRMQKCALLHGCIYEVTIPTIHDTHYPLPTIVDWALSIDKKRSNNNGIVVGSLQGIFPDDKSQTDTFELLDAILELDPEKRIDAKSALKMSFFNTGRVNSSEDEDETIDEIIISS